MSLPMSDLSQIDLTQKNQHGVDLSREVTQATEKRKAHKRIRKTTIESRALITPERNQTYLLYPGTKHKPKPKHLSSHRE